MIVIYWTDIVIAMAITLLIILATHKWNLRGMFITIKFQYEVAIADWALLLFWLAIVLGRIV